MLLIYADEFRFDALGATGNPDVKTPNIDALARDGVVYRNSFCTWPVCTPSRLSLLTGQYVQQHRGNSNRSTLPPHTPTFASILRDGGYRTKAVGKMHLSPAYQDVGFQEMLLAEQNGPGRNVDDYHRYLKSRGLINALDLIDQERRFRPLAPARYRENFGAEVSDLPEEHHITTWVGDRAVEAVETWEELAPNLLMVGFLKPHHPFDPPAPWHEMYDPETMTVLPGWTNEIPERDLKRSRGYFDNTSLTLPALKKVMAYYYATISHLDYQVGRIVEALKRKGLYENTLIVFTADHGDYLGFHHMILKGNHLYDPVVKVPLVIKYPGQRHRGTAIDELVNSLDVTSTILHFAQQERTEEMRGMPLGATGAGRNPPRDYVITQGTLHVMARTASRKLILARGVGPSFFFDLERDPYEMENRIDDPDYSGDVNALKNAILAWFMNDSGRNVYRDPGATLISTPNVPEDLKAAEEEMLTYFREKVTEYLEKQ